MKYIKKPKISEAFLFGSDNKPLWFLNEQIEGNISPLYTKESGKQAVIISTKEGLLEVFEGQYIVKNHKGELYAVKKFVFESLYEPYRGKAVK